ncbi:hypothetical protein Bbelb_027340, partial [Branchiostoma belcheri]
MGRTGMSSTVNHGGRREALFSTSMGQRTSLTRGASIYVVCMPRLAVSACVHLSLTNGKTSKQLRPLAECIRIAPTTLAHACAQTLGLTNRAPGGRSPRTGNASALFSPLAAADLQDFATA